MITVHQKIKRAAAKTLWVLCCEVSRKKKVTVAMTVTKDRRSAKERSTLWAS